MTSSWSRPRTWLLALIVLLPVWAPAAAGQGQAAGQSSQSQATEPTLSRQEADLLERADEAAQTDTSGAIDLLRRAITEESSPALTFALACYLYEQGDLREAEAAFGRCLDTMPFFHRARRNRAQLLLEDERYTEAAAELSFLLDAQASGGSQLWKLLGFALLADENAVAAETAYRNALALAPEDRDLRLMLIRTLVEQERYDEARWLVRKEIADRPLDGSLWQLLASIDLNQEKQRDALVALECAYRLGVADEKSLALLGDLCLEENLADQALERYRSTAAMERPPLARILNAVEAFLYQGHVEQGQALLSTVAAAEAESLEPHRIRVRFLHARMAEAEGSQDAALEGYRSVLADDPLNGDALLAAGSIFQAQQKYDDALVYLERAARTCPAHEFRALLRQAQIAVARQDYSHAYELLRACYEIKPEAYIHRYMEQVRAAASD